MCVNSFETQLTLIACTVTHVSPAAIFCSPILFGFQEITKWQKRREDSEETSQELRIAREQLQNTVLLPDFTESRYSSVKAR